MVVVISHPGSFKDECDWFKALIDAGLRYLHLRKPEATTDELRSLLDELPVQYRQYMMLHYHPDLAMEYGMGGVHLSSTQSANTIPEGYTGMVSKSCHSFTELEANDGKFDYFFLSPVRDSISKTGYSAKWKDEQLRTGLSGFRTSNVIALGGIDSNNAGEVMRLGFDGVAVLGTIWQSTGINEAIDHFNNINSQCQQAGHIQ